MKDAVPVVMVSSDADGPATPFDAWSALRTIAVLKQLKEISDELALPANVRAVLAHKALALLERVDATDLARMERAAIDAGELDAPAVQ